jgi:hypothetical protein
MSEQAVAIVVSIYTLDAIEGVRGLPWTRLRAVWKRFGPLLPISGPSVLSSFDEVALTRGSLFLIVVTKVTLCGDILGEKARNTCY